MAEAMLLGRPVIATLHSGQADLGDQGSCWPVDFELVQAKSHLTGGKSLWAEPSPDSLRRQMRNVFRASSMELSARTEAARQHIAANFTWEQVARKQVDVWDSLLKEDRIASSLATVSKPVHHIGFISSWNTKCGIAEYTRYLAQNLNSACRYSVFADRATELVRPDDEFAVRSWSHGASDPESHSELELLVRQILVRNVHAVSLQYNFGFFRPSAVEYLRRELSANGVSLIVTLHSTHHEAFWELARVLRRCALTIVHRTEDLQKLKDCGVTRSEIQQQGIHVPTPVPVHEATASKTRVAFTLACFGFFLPPKGVLDLLQAFEAAVRINPVLRLKLLNSLYPAPSSHSYVTECLRFIERRGLGGHVDICTNFLDDDTIVQGLRDADMVVLPYTHSSESSSAAIRLPLASLTPILCSDLKIFDEFRHVVHRYRAGDVFELANRIIDLSTNPSELAVFAEGQRELVDRLSWPKTAAHFYELVSRCGSPS
jgi:glycosyltransferase involved in cell wall biosynthesis